MSLPTDDPADDPALDFSELASFTERLLSTAASGLAIVNVATGRSVLVNDQFRRWLGDMRLTDFLAGVEGLDWPDKAPADGESVEADKEIKVGRRGVALKLRVTGMNAGGDPLVAVEARDISRLKELEYMMESYTRMLERSEREVRREKERAEKLLLNIMPRQVYDEMRTIGVSTPQRYDDCSILMLDFVDFTEISVAQDPSALVAELNDIFTAFDRICEQFGCERIKTLGDAYIAVCGVPDPSTDHAINIASVAQRMVRYLDRRNTGRELQWKCRIGIASGPVVGSMVGVQKYVYDIFGPGVNLAARLEHLAGPMQILVSESMEPALRNHFDLEPAGEADLKGFGHAKLLRLGSGGR